MIERAITISLARKFDVDEYSIEREFIQLIFLRNFYRLAGSVNIYFKGGTAIHYLLHSFRFSEDLDFTATETKPEVKKLVRNTLGESNLEAPGLVGELLTETMESMVYRLNFPTELSIRPLTIRLEFSFREKPLSRRVSVIETELPVSPYPMVVHFDFEEILAEKLRALLIRGKGRDVFDCWYLLSKDIQPKVDLIRKKMLFYKQDFSIDRLKKTIEGMDLQALKDDLEKFLPKSHRKVIGELPAMLLYKIKAYRL